MCYSSGKKEGLNRKDELFNDLVDKFVASGLDFPRSTADTDGKYMIQVCIPVPVNSIHKWGSYKWSICEWQNVICD